MRSLCDSLPISVDALITEYRQLIIWSVLHMSVKHSKWWTFQVIAYDIKPFYGEIHEIAFEKLLLYY